MPTAPLFLSAEEVAAALDGRLADLGAAGGGIGGGIGAGAVGSGAGAGALGGAAGGSFGARIGAKFTKLDGHRRQWAQPATPELLDRLRRFLPAPGERTLNGPNTTSAVGLFALVGSGSMNMNPCLIEAVWDAAGLQVAAHAREGLIKQRTCEKALDRLQAEVFGAAEAG